MKNSLLKILFISAFSLLSFVAKSQNYCTIIASNALNCDVDIRVITSTTSYTFTVPANTAATNYVVCGSGIPTNVIFFEGTSCEYQQPPMSSGTCGCTGCCLTSATNISNTLTAAINAMGPCGFIGFHQTQTITIT